MKILGSAAGGGFPQWNCNTRLSRLARDCEANVQRRTQSSIAVSADGKRWVLVNASPDIRQQIDQTVALQPSRSGPLRNSPIIAVFLTNTDVDHVAGLLSLRERHPFQLFATAPVLAAIEQSVIFNVLDKSFVKREPLAFNESVHLDDLRITPFPVAGKVALYLEDAMESTNFGAQAGETIGLEISGGDAGKLMYIPGCAAIDNSLLDRVHGSDCLLFDGTVFTDNEMAEAGVGEKTGRRMGHIPISGEGGSLNAFDNAAIGRKIYAHINTTNPILEPGSIPERAVIAAGWEIAFDGMSFVL